jgi:beta-mannosidase
MKVRDGFILRLVKWLLAAAMLCSGAIVAAAVLNEHPRVDQLLDGGDWRMGSYDPGQGEAAFAFAEDFQERGFRTVVVPGDTQLQAGLTGIERFRDSKELITVNQREWWYRKHFRVKPVQTGSITRLVFDGADYFASVWLNGKLLGEHEGTYTAFSFDVTKLLRTTGENMVAVRVTHPWVPKDRALNEYLNGNFTMTQPWSNATLDKPPYFMDVSWDALPAQGNAAFDMGIWRSVHLVSSSPITISDVFVGTKEIAADGTATLQIAATIDNATAETRMGRLTFEMRPDNFRGAARELPALEWTAAPGKTTLSEEVKVEHAHLWWSWDQGAQEMYDMSARLLTGDMRSVRFGIRTVARDDDMSYRLNGRRVFIKASWFPIADYYRSTPTRESYERDLRLFRDGNFNLTVNFTVVEKPEFYELCDELGILVVEELPVQQFGPVRVLDADSPRKEPFLRQATRQFSEIILANRNHPSIIEWAPLAEAHDKNGKWGFYTMTLDQQGYQDFADRARTLVADLAPGAIFQTSLCDFGEQHFWIAGGQRGNTQSYQELFDASAKFISEYGAISMSSYENLGKYLSPAQQWNPHMQDTSLRWFGLPIDAPAYSYWTSFMDDGFFGMLYRAVHSVDRTPRSARELVADTQLYQAFLLKYATQAFRRKKYAPVQGIRSWDFVELAPGFRFGIVDYDRVPKTAYYYMKQALAPVAVSFAYKGALESQLAGRAWSAPVWVVNDRNSEIDGTVRAELLTVQGNTLASVDLPVHVAADGKAEAGSFALTLPTEAGVYVLRAQITARQLDNPVTETSYIKVIEPAFAQQPRVLLVGQRKYAQPISEMLAALGAQVDVYDEHRLEAIGADLSDGVALHARYDAIWLSSFEALAKVLPEQSAHALAEAVHLGTGFVHTGGDGSFHGGHGHAAIVEATALNELLPVSSIGSNDVVGGPYTLNDTQQDQHAIHEVTALQPVSPESAEMQRALARQGVTGFNQVEPRPGSRVLLSIAGRPLLVKGEFGKGHVIAFTGFTPPADEFSGTTMDNQLLYRPSTGTHLRTFAELLALVLPGQPSWKRESLSQRETPLFETLKNLPATQLNSGMSGCEKTEHGGRCRLRIGNGQGYAHLVHLRVEWNSEAPYFAELSDDDFELLPHETREIELQWHGREQRGKTHGSCIIDAANAPEVRLTF